MEHENKGENQRTGRVNTNLFRAFYPSGLCQVTPDGLRIPYEKAATIGDIEETRAKVFSKIEQLNAALYAYQNSFYVDHKIVKHLESNVLKHLDTLPSVNALQQAIPHFSRNILPDICLDLPLLNTSKFSEKSLSMFKLLFKHIASRNLGFTINLCANREALSNDDFLWLKPFIIDFLEKFSLTRVKLLLSYELIFNQDIISFCRELSKHTHILDISFHLNNPQDCRKYTEWMRLAYNQKIKISYKLMVNASSVIQFEKIMNTVPFCEYLEWGNNNKIIYANRFNNDQLFLGDKCVYFGLLMKRAQCLVIQQIGDGVDPILLKILQKDNIQINTVLFKDIEKEHTYTNTTTQWFLDIIEQTRPQRCVFQGFKTLKWHFLKKLDEDTRNNLRIIEIPQYFMNAHLKSELFTLKQHIFTRATLLLRD
jgi:hypothetical protein